MHAEQEKTHRSVLNAHTHAGFTYGRQHVHDSLTHSDLRQRWWWWWGGLEWATRRAQHTHTRHIPHCTFHIAHRTKNMDGRTDTHARTHGTRTHLQRRLQILHASMDVIRNGIFDKALAVPCASNCTSSAVSFLETTGTALGRDMNYVQ